MSTIFTETIARAISDYRYLLRRYLTQADRMAKLNELNLRDTSIYQDEVVLFEIAHKIVNDIEGNMDTEQKGYYSYSGIAHFSTYLKEFLKNYECDGNRVTHKAQKASRMLIYVIQLFMKTETDLTPDVATDFMRCSQVIAENGSVEQKDLYLNNLRRHKDTYPNFYGPLLNDFEIRMQQSQTQATSKAVTFTLESYADKLDAGTEGMEGDYSGSVA